VKVTLPGPGVASTSARMASISSGTLREPPLPGLSETKTWP
jgi:hypothetical protein